MAINFATNSPGTLIILFPFQEFPIKIYFQGRMTFEKCSFLKFKTPPILRGNWSFIAIAALILFESLNGSSFLSFKKTKFLERVFIHPRGIWKCIISTKRIRKDENAISNLQRGVELFFAYERNLEFTL